MREILKESINGITREIESRLSKIQVLIDCVIGNERRFTKQVKNSQPTIAKALVLYREVRRLKVIKKELQLLKLIEDLNYDIRRTTTRSTMDHPPGLCEKRRPARMPLLWKKK